MDKKILLEKFNAAKLNASNDRCKRRKELFRIQLEEFFKEGGQLDDNIYKSAEAAQGYYRFDPNSYWSSMNITGGRHMLEEAIYNAMDRLGKAGLKVDLLVIERPLAGFIVLW